MAWIEYHEGLREHWKVQRLADSLSGEYLYALGAITCLWLWCIKYAPDGDLKKFTDAEIRCAARTKSEKFCKSTLIACGLLTDNEEINDWKKHGIKYLVSTRKRMKKYRKSLRNANASVTPIPNPTLPNPTLPKDIGICVSYFKELGFESEAKKFFDYFASNGWKVGGRAPMKDWQAAARNWVRRLPPSAKAIKQDDYSKKVEQWKKEAVPPPAECAKALEKLGVKI